jgi:hypothetical protein
VCDEEMEEERERMGMELMDRYILGRSSFTGTE